MTTDKEKIRRGITIAIALVLTLSVGLMGTWLLFGRKAHLAGEHQTNLGGAADKGVLGGYTGTATLLMVIFLTIMVASLLFTLWRERPGPSKISACWNCARPVEADWESCPYCGSDLSPTWKYSGKAV